MSKVYLNQSGVSKALFEICDGTPDVSVELDRASRQYVIVRLHQIINTYN